MKLSPILSASVALLLAACGTDIFGEGKGDVYTSSVKQADEARTSGDLDAAIPLYGRALEANPHGVEAKLGLGQAYLSAGLADEAAAQFRDVLDKKAGNQIARRGLALALISMGQPELAERQLEAALLADGRDYRTLNAYGVVLDMMAVMPRPRRVTARASSWRPATCRCAATSACRWQFPDSRRKPSRNSCRWPAAGPPMAGCARTWPLPMP
jgi:Flp pilus assembly protein TadD